MSGTGAIPTGVLTGFERVHEVSATNAEGPPVPIPNTEVKLSSAEDTWLETARENRSVLTPSSGRDRRRGREGNRAVLRRGGSCASDGGTVGVTNAEGPPVPIPNTEVKLSSAEDTRLETARENRSMPTHGAAAVSPRKGGGGVPLEAVPGGARAPCGWGTRERYPGGGVARLRRRQFAGGLCKGRPGKTGLYQYNLIQPLFIKIIVLTRKGRRVCLLSSVGRNEDDRARRAKQGVRVRAAVGI